MKPTFQKFAAYFGLFAFLIVPTGFWENLRLATNLNIDNQIEVKSELFDKILTEFVPGQLLVKFKGELEPRLLNLPAGPQVLDAVRAYRDRSDVVYAEPNYVVRALTTPNDPYFSLQWHLDNPAFGGIHAPSAWDVAWGNGVVVAVVDTGIAYENYTKGGKRYYQAPDLSGTCFAPGYDFVEKDTHPNDDNSHGTHVAGTVAQKTNNGVGVAGVAYSVCLMPVKVLDRNGTGSLSTVAAGIRFAADNGAQVINLSLGTPTYSQTLLDAVAYAYGKGVVLVAAAGNDGGSQILYPAAYDDYVIAVGATRYNETRTNYSNSGISLDLVAPGGDTSLDQNGDGYPDGVLQNTFNPNTKNTSSFGYWFFQGTSMAAPHAAGVAALVISRGNAVAPNEVKAALQATADDLGVSGWDSFYGHGLVNAAAALSWQAASPPPPPANLPPVANAGLDKSAYPGQTVSFDGSGSFDSDGVIVNYAWNYGDGGSGLGAVSAHSYAAVGVYTATLTVTDDAGAAAQDTATVIVIDPTAEIEVFFDSFESNGWNGLWTQDSQNAWFHSSQRAMDGTRSAEVDGFANNAWLMSVPVDLQGRANARISFSWLIESSFDSGEYLIFEISTNGGSTWVETAGLRGNVDAENVWHNASLELVGIADLRMRFKGAASLANEDANVDLVKVVAW